MCLGPLHPCNAKGPGPKTSCVSRSGLEKGASPGSLLGVLGWEGRPSQVRTSVCGSVSVPWAAHGGGPTRGGAWRPRPWLQTGHAPNAVSLQGHSEMLWRCGLAGARAVVAAFHREWACFHVLLGGYSYFHTKGSWRYIASRASPPF